MADSVGVVHVLIRNHTPSETKAYADGLVVDWRNTPPGRIEGYAIDCACGHRGVMWVTPEGAVNEYLRHAQSVLLEVIRLTSPELDPSFLRLST